MLYSYTEESEFAQPNQYLRLSNSCCWKQIWKIPTRDTQIGCISSHKIPAVTCSLGNETMDNSRNDSCPKPIARWWKKENALDLSLIAGIVAMKFLWTKLILLQRIFLSVALAAWRIRSKGPCQHRAEQQWPFAAKWQQPLSSTTENPLLQRWTF